MVAMLCRTLWCLLRRRLLPYPSLEELQERRRNTAQARQFGEEVQQWLSTSTIGPVELWQIFRHYSKASTQNNAKSSAKEKLREKVSDGFNQSDSVLDLENKAILEYGDDGEEEDLKRDLLHLMEIVADIHERIKKYVWLVAVSFAGLILAASIFLWRRPTATKRYGIVCLRHIMLTSLNLFQLLSITMVAVFVLPAHYITKLIYLFLGAIYWHVIPVIAALSPADRARQVYYIYHYFVASSRFSGFPLSLEMCPLMQSMLWI